MNGKDLRIVFMGTPDFAVGSLKALVEGAYNIVGVITSPDKPAGRGRKLVESAVKKYALGKGLKVLQPEKLKNPEFISELKELNANVQVVVAFRMLPEVVWAMPRLGTFNLHGSLLPQYRGAAPLNWAVINGETETGVTTFLLDKQIDTGKILFKEKTPIGLNETVGDVHDRLLEIGAKLVLRTVDSIAEGNIKPVPQEQLITGGGQIKHAPKIFKEDCKIDWSADAETIRNLVRGLSPYPAAWTNLIEKETGKSITAKIFLAGKELAEKTEKAGAIISDGKTYLKIACLDGWITIKEIQLAGKKRMAVEELLRGFKNIENYGAG